MRPMARWNFCQVLALILLLVLPATGSAIEFTDISETSGAGDRGQGESVALADFDADGDLDLYISNQGGGSVLYLNDGNGIFTPAGRSEVSST